MQLIDNESFMKYIGYLIPVLILSSCTTLFFGQDPSGKNLETYEYLTSAIDERYALFDIKEVDWELAKSEYRNLMSDSLTDQELLKVMGHLIGNLEDGHTNIYGQFDYSRYWDWYLDYPSNFDFELIERHYLNKNYWRTGPFFHTEIDSIAYVYYGSFSPLISGKQLNYLLDKIAPMKGVVFDIRNNGGGKLLNVKILMSAFADTTRVTHDFYFKTGAGKDDFTEKVNYTIKPHKKAFNKKPVVVLTNRKSYSGATFFPAGMRVFPHVTIMGDHTGGGGGVPYHFELPNGWIFRLSATRTIDSRGKNIEPGILPDVEAFLDEKAADKGVDTVIEKAIVFIKKKNGEI